MAVKNPNAVGYVRCSTEQQEDSPEQQKSEILRFASQRGLEIVHWYVDFGKSGTTFAQRPEFQRMLEAVETGAGFSFVICYDESRWGRAIDSRENMYWQKHFEMRGVEVLLVRTSVDRGHEFAPLFQSLEGIQASQYSKKLSELTLRGARENGQYCTLWLQTMCSEPEEWHKSDPRRRGLDCEKAGEGEVGPRGCLRGRDDQKGLRPESLRDIPHSDRPGIE
jgi:hypothetical protein